MSTEHLRRGWCPTLHKPMETGDGLLVRVAIRAHTLNAATACRIAELSLLHGNGYLDLSQRANVQIRGVTQASYPHLLEALLALGLGGNAHLLVSPLCGIDPTCDANAHAFATSLQAAFDLVELPPKFLCIVNGGGVFPLEGMASDIRFDVQDGIYTSSMHTPAKPRAAYACVGEMAFAGTRVVGLALPFGRMHADALTTLAGLAQTYGDGTLRVSPWRTIFIPGVSDTSAVMRKAHAAGFITDPQDARRAVQACPGAPGCVRAHGETHALANAIAAGLPGLCTSGKTIHVSGCAKGCAYPKNADAVVTASNKNYAIAFDASADSTPAHENMSPDDILHLLSAWQENNYNEVAYEHEA